MAFKAGASSGNLILLSSQTASGASTVTFTGMTGYDNYFINYYDVTLASGDGTLNMQFSTDGGSTWITTGSYSVAGTSCNDAAVTGAYAVAGGTSFLINGIHSNGTTWPVSTTIYIYSLGVAKYKNIFCQAVENQAGAMRNTNFGGTLQSTSVCNAAKIFPGAGTVSGKFKLYGVQN